MLLKTQNRFFEFFLLKLRNVLSKIYNPNITLKVENFVLTLPFNHNLPFYLKKYPNYDRQLSKIASLIQKISGKLYMIDVGANIGDTITLVNIKQNASFLLIEGDEKYNALIQTNINNNFNTMGGGGSINLSIKNTFISDSPSQNSWTISSQNGTSNLSKTDENNTLPFKTLDEICLEESFIPNLLKIDTDGFDFQVIRSAKTIIKQHHPCIYFEWHKAFLEQAQEDPLSIFDFLIQNEYLDLFIFDNFGNFLCHLQSNDYEILSSLLSYSDQAGTIFYYDVLAISKKYPITIQEILNTIFPLKIHTIRDKL